MVRYIITGFIGALVGAGLLVLLFFVTNPIPSSLVCSIGKDRKITDCVDQNGKKVKPPHSVRIRE